MKTGVKMNNVPFYFYHLVPKNADMKNGLISLKYMYDHKLWNLFDQNVLKYKDRIVHDWNIDKFQNKKNLRRKDYIEALNIFRGDNGANAIYFFRYPPFKNLGSKIEELSKEKDIYRIDLNNPKVKEHIENIFWGFDLNEQTSKLLNITYYENISVTDYFSKYNDNLTMNFSRINHISIYFKDGFCPFEFLEKVSWN